MSVNERNVLADTARVVAEKNKACKRKTSSKSLLWKVYWVLVMMLLSANQNGRNPHLFLVGEYEYVELIVEGERRIIDIDLLSEFEVARSTKTFKSILQTLPNIL